MKKQAKTKKTTGPELDVLINWFKIEIQNHFVDKKPGERQATAGIEMKGTHGTKQVKVLLSFFQNGTLRAPKYSNGLLEVDFAMTQLLSILAMLENSVITKNLRTHVTMQSFPAGPVAIFAVDSNIPPKNTKKKK